MNNNKENELERRKRKYQKEQITKEIEEKTQKRIEEKTQKRIEEKTQKRIEEDKEKEEQIREKKKYIRKQVLSLKKQRMNNEKKKHNLSLVKFNQCTNELCQRYYPSIEFYQCLICYSAICQDCIQHLSRYDKDEQYPNHQHIVCSSSCFAILIDNSIKKF